MGKAKVHGIIEVGTKAWMRKSKMPLTIVFGPLRVAGSRMYGERLYVVQNDDTGSYFLIDQSKLELSCVRSSLY